MLLTGVAVGGLLKRWSCESGDWELGGKDLRDWRRCLLKDAAAAAAAAAADAEADAVWVRRFSAILSIFLRLFS